MASVSNVISKGKIGMERRIRKNKFLFSAYLLPKITVKDPVTHDTWDHGKYTSYLICIKTEHPAFHLQMSAVRRRFSEVRWLYETIKSNHKYVNLPTPPPKKILRERFNPVLIQERMKEIENFLNELLVTDTILSDAAFHLFMQTDLTIHEITEYFHGRLPEAVVQLAWNNSGHIHSSSFVVNTKVIPIEPQEIVMNEEDLHLSGRLPLPPINFPDLRELRPLPKEDPTPPSCPTVGEQTADTSHKVSDCDVSPMVVDVTVHSEASTPSVSTTTEGHDVSDELLPSSFGSEASLSESFPQLLSVNPTEDNGQKED